MGTLGLWLRRRRGRNRCCGFLMGDGHCLEVVECLRWFGLGIVG
jgi:hypothetical protein